MKNAIQKLDSSDLSKAFALPKDAKLREAHLGFFKILREVWYEKCPFDNRKRLEELTLCECLC